MCSFHIISGLTAVCLVFNLSNAHANLNCQDENGEDVDWFYVYKLPKNVNSKNLRTDKSGLRYFYITSKNYDAWSHSNYKISELTSLPARTLRGVLNDSNIFLIAYNDQFPNGTTIITGGHAKGVVATNGQQGIWLVHSVPKFPTIPTYDYPESGAQNGQSFLCLSLKAEEMDKIGQLLSYNQINIYNSNVPEALKGKFPRLEAALNRTRFKTGPFQIVLNIQTADGKKFKGFAKSKKFSGDLYEDLVAPTLDSNLLVETWRNGGGNLASNCTKDRKVYNIVDIQSETWDIGFKSTSDHSKWAVSEAKGVKLWRWRIGGADWICIGDINRQNHQKARGGGTVCQKSSRVAQLYRELIGSFEPCNKPLY